MTPHETQFIKAMVDGGLITFTQAGELERERAATSDGGETKSVWDLAVEKGLVSSDQVRVLLSRSAVGGASAGSDGSSASAVVRGASSRLGGYELLSKLGQGGMGAVYKARQEAMDRLVAIKVLPRSLARDESFITRFLREARAAGRLSHPNIVAGIDAGFADGYYYFAMEFVEGTNLGERLQGSGPLPEREAVEYARQVALALDHANGAGIVHRDVKPENILVTPGGQAKLCDLGLARTSGEDMRVTQAGMAVGTPYYISPEQAMGQEPDARSDVYSLGCTLFHLVSGGPPFDGSNALAIMQMHIAGPVPDLCSVCPAASRALEAVVRRMTARDPAARYQSAAEAAEELGKVAGGGVPAALGAAMAARHSSRGTGGTSATRPVPARRAPGGSGRHRPVAEEKPRKRSFPIFAVAAAALVIFGLGLAWGLLGGGDGGDSGAGSGSGSAGTTGTGGSSGQSGDGGLSGTTAPRITAPGAFSAEWSELAIEGEKPPLRSIGYGALAYDSKRRRLFFGSGMHPHQNDLWALDLTARRWQCLQPPDLNDPGVGTTRPPPTHPTDTQYWDYDPGADLYRLCFWRWAYDPNTGKWTQGPLRISGTDNSPIRVGWARDPATNRFLLLKNGSCGTLDMKTGSYSPIARLPEMRSFYDGGLVYDPLARVFVLFGGQVYQQPAMSTTWTYDPAADSWRQMQPKTVPPARYAHRLLWHDKLGAIVMFGGSAKPERLLDLWVYETAADRWTEVKTAAVPPSTGATAYDASQNLVVLYTSAGQLWTLRIDRARAGE